MPSVILLAGPAGLDPASVREALSAAVNRGRGYGVDLPERSLEPAAPSTGGIELPPRGPRIDPAVSAGSTLLYWTLAGIALLLIVSWFARQWLGYRAPPDDGGPGGDRGDAPVDVVEADVEALLRRGDYAGAIHRLLKISLRRANGGREPAAALTARAALRSLELAPEARTALSVLVEAVERVRYAGLTADAALWERCRDAARRVNP